MTLCANCGKPEGHQDHSYQTQPSGANAEPICFFTPAPPEDGWLTEEEVRGWRIKFQAIFTEPSQVHTDALCRMALAALAYRKGER